MQQVMFAKQQHDQQFGDGMNNGNGFVNGQISNNVNDALVAKLDVVIEQNRHLQSQIQQGKIGMNSNNNQNNNNNQNMPYRGKIRSRLNEEPYDTQRRIKRKNQEAKRRKKKEVVEQKKTVAHLPEEDEPVEEFKLDNSDPNTYHMDNEIESGGAKSAELEKTENWFKTQFATRQTRRRKGLVGGVLQIKK